MMDHPNTTKPVCQSHFCAFCTTKSDRQHKQHLSSRSSQHHTKLKYLEKTSQAMIACDVLASTPTFDPPAKIKTQTSVSFAFWKGAATEWVRSDFCKKVAANDMSFAATWRRWRDSNSRTVLPAYRISSADPSTTWVHLRIYFLFQTCPLSHIPAEVASFFPVEIYLNA